MFPSVPSVDQPKNNLLSLVGFIGLKLFKVAVGSTSTSDNCVPSKSLNFTVTCAGAFFSY